MVTTPGERPAADRAEDLLALLGALPAWRLICDARDRIVSSWVPKGREAPLGLPDRGRGALADAKPEKAASTLLETVGRCRAGGAPVTVVLELGAEGAKRTYEVRAVPLTDGRVGVLGLDVSARAAVLEALRRSEERFRLAFKTSPDSIAINRTSDGTYVAVNQGFCDLLGWQEDEVLGRTSLDLGIWAHQEQRAALLAELARNGRAKIEATFRRRSGELGTGSMSAVLFEVDGASHILSVTRDVTAEREAEREREQLEQALRQSQKLESIGILASGVAHEFRNLLQIIHVYADLLRKRLPGETSTVPLLRELDQAVERGADITGRLLAFSRKAEVRVTRIDANEVVREVVRILEHTLPKTIRLEVRLTPGALPVDGDPGQLSQVLLNLAVNARDAMPQGGVLELTSERIVPEAGDRAAGEEDFGRGELAALGMRDDGQGMDESTIQRIFDPFFTTKPPAHGTGLGLSVAYGIVKAHGGQIRCVSRPGEGTAFTVLLPAASGPVPAARPTVRPAATHAGREAILVVDDEPAILWALELQLSEDGYRPRTVASGEEAVAACREGDFDAVVMDLGLPGLGGEACLREIRRVSPRAKIIVSSGSAWDGWREAGAAAFLSKPYPLSELLATLRQLLDGPE